MEQLELAMQSLLETQAMANKLLNVSIALGIIAFLISVGCLVWLLRRDGYV